MSARYVGIDAWVPGEILEAMVEGQMAAIAAVRAVLPDLEGAAEATLERLKQGGRLVYVGAGTSGRVAVQDGAELIPTFDWPADRLVLIMAGGDAALLRSMEGVEDDEAAARTAIDRHGVGANDVAIGLAASGRTKFTCAALAAARNLGALTIGVANNAGTPLLTNADHAILLDTGAEVIAGSTRMKAGTAQKAVLNLFSSLVMIRLGRVHDGLMVDVRSLNQKLVKRTQAMVARLAGCSQEQARAALARSDGHVKTAVLVAKGLTPEAARVALDERDGYLRAALDAMRLPTA